MDTLITRKMEKKDLQEVLKIYKEGIETGMATFETIVPSEQVWDERHHATLRFVAEENNRVVGWIGISPVSTRAVYSGVGEVSVYISSDRNGKGIVSKLLKILIEESEKEGFGHSNHPSLRSIHQVSNYIKRWAFELLVQEKKLLN